MTTVRNFEHEAISDQCYDLYKGNEVAQMLLEFLEQHGTRYTDGGFLKSACSFGVLTDQLWLIAKDGSGGDDGNGFHQVGFFREVETHNPWTNEIVPIVCLDRIDDHVFGIYRHEWIVTLNGQAEDLLAEGQIDLDRIRNPDLASMTMDTLLAAYVEPVVDQHQGQAA